MPYFLIVQHKKNGNYYTYKTSFRENGKVKSKYVYLGNEEAALKLLADFNSKKPSNERLLSFSGEDILSKVLEMLDFKNVINKAIQNDTKLDAGRFIEIIVVERALNTFSKWGLADHAHGKSIFSLDASIPSDKFTEANIYHYMDYLHPNIDLIQESLVKTLLRIDDLELNELIIDGTSVSCFGDDETEDEIDDDEESDEDEPHEHDNADKYKEIKRVHGYSRNKRPDLAQVNLMLGVSDQSIPLLFQTFPGNAPDVYMFQSILEKCQRDYSSLLAKVRSKYIIFDKGNNNPKNFKMLDALCKKWQFHFVASIRPSLVAVRKELLALTIENTPLIYTQKKTVLRGKTTSITLYGENRNVLLYINEEIMKQKQDEFQEKIKQVKEEIREHVKHESSAKEKVGKIENLLRKNGLLACFTVQVKKDVVKCAPIKEKLEMKLNVLGKYALMTDDASLGAASMIRIYKTTGVVEQEFHLLKSELAIGPIFHRKPERIQVHFAMILWGMMALALLRYLLKKSSLEFTFEELRAKIQEGRISIGDHVYPDDKSYRIRKSLNVGKELIQVEHKQVQINRRGGDSKRIN
jgi:transposase